MHDANAQMVSTSIPVRPIFVTPLEHPVGGVRLGRPTGGGESMLRGMCGVANCWEARKRSVFYCASIGGCHTSGLGSLASLGHHLKLHALVQSLLATQKDFVSTGSDMPCRQLGIVENKVLVLPTNLCDVSVALPLLWETDFFIPVPWPSNRTHSSTTTTCGRDHHGEACGAMISGVRTWQTPRATRVFDH